jgi:hypothetical protein
LHCYKSARDAYVASDPAFSKLIGACNALNLDPPLDPTGPGEAAMKVGLYKLLNPVVTRSLNAPGFQPLSL